MKRRDYFLAIFLCVFGATVFLLSNTIPTKVAVEKSSVVNSRFFPKLMSGSLAILGIVLALQNLLKMKSIPQPDARDGRSSPADLEEKRKSVSKLILAGGLIFLYLVVFNRLGFLISSILFMGCFLWVLGNRHWPALLLVSLFVPVILYLVFRLLLAVMLPRGILPF
jgi:putative tricarboxylic transport membrane protein